MNYESIPDDVKRKGWILLRILIVIVIRLITNGLLSPRQATLKIAKENDVSFSRLWAMLPDTYK